MDNESRSIIRSLEVQNEALGQDLAIANQKALVLEQQVADLLGFDDGTPIESQIDFIRKVAESRTKFAKEAQAIVAAVDAASNTSVDTNA